MNLFGIFCSKCRDWSFEFGWTAVNDKTYTLLDTIFLITIYLIWLKFTKIVSNHMSQFYFIFMNV